MEQIFRVGIDNYSLFPMNLEPVKVMKWARQNGAEGVAFSGLQPGDTYPDRGYLRALTEYAKENNLYLEWGGARHIPRDMNSWSRKDLFEHNRRCAREAETIGTRIVRSCSGGLMRWNPANPSTKTLLGETADALRDQKQMLMDHDVILAIETHFEFTTFELLRIFEMCGASPGEFLGICLDTMNLLIMLEDPVKASERILPWVVSTHIKDGGIIWNDKGLTAFPVETGTGIVDLGRIVELLRNLEYPVNLSVEDHGGEFLMPVFDPVFLSEFPDLGTSEFIRLSELAEATRQKINNGEIAPLSRDIWPDICENRVIKDIANVRELVSEIYGNHV
ncbi:MAG: sugar phosphate isomerase/epimerase [Bacteroidales bacterium]|nr:MAG: sugar phosphate isomerase/epimerase [Bacteroidales bacterium]